jgi:hypothetical protein
MKLKLLLITLLLPGMLKAQNCLTRTDVQTGKVIKSGTTELFTDSVSRPSRFTFLKTDSSLSIGLSIVSTLTVSNFDAANMKLTVTYVNGQEKAFNANSSTGIAAIPGGTGIIFQASVTSADISYFHDNFISHLTLSFGDQSGGKAVTIPVSELNAGVIVNSLICLTSTE